ncbi:MAG: VF530 family DNA-binding protein [Planctomycetota bacterium]|nr:VF530 family DNA-binding protein [Planctomycetota bacterium]
MTPEQPNNPLHGVTLKTIVEQLYLADLRRMEREETRD